MKVINRNTKPWIIMWALWMLAMLVTSHPVFAANEEPDDAPLVPRNSFELSYSDAEEAITRALTEKGVGDKVSAIINGHNAKAIFAYGKPVTVQTKGLQYDMQSGYWSASLLFVADGEIISALPASGHFNEMVEVPVLKREIRNGDIIKDTDIEVRDFPTNHTRSDTISDLSSLIGKSAAHSISPFRPIRAQEISSPALIKKDTMVEMRYSLPGMEISTSGQALVAGAKGDVITVRNVASKKVVRAVVESSDTVSILATGVEHAEN